MSSCKQGRSGAIIYWDPFGKPGIGVRVRATSTQRAIVLTCSRVHAADNGIMGHHQTEKKDMRTVEQSNINFNI